MHGGVRILLLFLRRAVPAQARPAKTDPDSSGQYPFSYMFFLPLFSAKTVPGVMNTGDGRIFVAIERKAKSMDVSCNICTDMNSGGGGGMESMEARHGN